VSEQITHHVTVRLARAYEFVAEFNDLPDSPGILFDEPAPLGEGRAPNAAAVLAAAVGNCLSASLAFCVRRAHLKLDDLTADVRAHVSRNEQGRLRIDGIDVQLTPQLRETDRARFDRCQALFEDFCTVTASVRRGIPVNVSVNSPAAETVGRAGNPAAREISPVTPA
jgi:organic hydroperoxide reductase OsmC/OhrA